MNPSFWSRDSGVYVDVPSSPGDGWTLISPLTQVKEKERMERQTSTQSAEPGPESGSPVNYVQSPGGGWALISLLTQVKEATADSA